MAWQSVGVAGSTGITTANQTTARIILNRQAGSGADFGDVLVGIFATHNGTTANNVDVSAVSGVADTRLNTWAKVREVQAGGVVQSAALCSLWYTRADVAMTTTDSVVVSFTSATQRDASAHLIWRFKTSGAMRVSQSTFLAVVNSSVAGSLDLSENGTEFLRFRGVGSDSTVTTFTTTAGWDSAGMVRVSGTNPMAAYGEFLVSTASTAASNPSLATSTHNQASVYATFEEINLMGAKSL
jgi:hypothetical protein